MSDYARQFAYSWQITEGCERTSDVLAWVAELNHTVRVDIRKTTLAETGWFYDEPSGQIVNAKHSFFQISGFRNGNTEQPILIQDEIGYLGFLCKEIGGVLHFLTQAKIEPGNVNKIQLSPTIQATKSNFTQRHGGARPPYLDWFLNAGRHTVVVDQLQSEQGSRFLKKRNRNIVVLLEPGTAVEESPRHRWLTLGQLKRLMRIDNLVNMDSRTVLSCIPFYRFIETMRALERVADPALIRSIGAVQPDALPQVFRHINDAKMFSESRPQLVPLYSLGGWGYEGGEFARRGGYAFKVVFCDISIEGREVRHWGQPLLEARGAATLGLFTATARGVRYFLAHAEAEIACHDTIELGPTVQLDASEPPRDPVASLFMRKRAARERVLYDVTLSEEGGRFYHEQNINCIIEIDKDELGELPPGYFWLTYHTLNALVQANNVLNIQLRNLLALLEI
jgi:oxidase EvaA